MWAPLNRDEHWIMDMFQLALQLEEPWKLTHIEFSREEQAWHLHLDFEPGSLFACPLCGAECKAYDSDTKHWRHLDFWDWKTFMHARMPRVN
ncbi:transposase family protein [Paenibacillus sp. 8b26]|uniref:transposase family protein n=1 Tax=Paenibacillus sp. 8b26 TaxID=3424133 RepID=UPI003D6521BB